LAVGGKKGGGFRGHRIKRGQERGKRVNQKTMSPSSGGRGASEEL